MFSYMEAAVSGAPTEPEAIKRAVPIPDLGFLDDALSRGGEALKAAIRNVRPADLGRELSRRPSEDACAILAALDDRRGAAMLRASHPAVAAGLLERTEPKRAIHLLTFMPRDHEVAIVGKLPPEVRARIEQAYSAERRAELDRVLGTAESAVGRLMTPRIWRCERTSTVGAAMAALREHADEIEVAVNCYVTDGARLVGVVPLRAMAILPQEAALADVMTPNPIAVREDTSRGDAADIINTHDFLSLPIIDGHDRLVGAVRVDDLLGAALETVGTGILNQGAVAGEIAGRAPYFLTPILRTVRSRITWLILLFVAETATGTVLRYFDDELAKVVALSFFVPLLIGTGGNAGSQTVSTIIRALALGEVQMRDVGRVIRREVTAGVMLGVLLGTIAFFRALMWGVGTDLAACVAVTILVVCTWANAVGAAIPLAAQRVGIDPTVISAPLITTLVDASGLFIYFTIAKLMIAALSVAAPTQVDAHWQSVDIVASAGTTTVHLKASADAQGHVRALEVNEAEAPTPWLSNLPPLLLDSAAIAVDRGQILVTFATDDEEQHVRLTVDHGRMTQAMTTKLTKEGKESRETRNP